MLYHKVNLQIGLSPVVQGEFPPERGIRQMCANSRLHQPPPMFGGSP